MPRRSKALAWDEIHNKPTANTAATIRLFMGGSSIGQDNRETETETTNARVAGTAGPAVLLAFAAGRNRDRQRLVSTRDVVATLC
jgi:hypothetical protein